MTDRRLAHPMLVREIAQLSREIVSRGIVRDEKHNDFATQPLAALEPHCA